VARNIICFFWKIGLTEQASTGINIRIKCIWLVDPETDWQDVASAKNNKNEGLEYEVLSRSERVRARRQNTLLA
jgi:hypothetical protein